MKKVLLALLIFFGLYSNAQIFAPPGAMWNYTAVDPWNWDYTYTQNVVYIGDSIINDTLTKKIRAGFFLYEEYYYFYST